MEPLITITALGVPGPQGSKNGRPIYKGKGKNRVFTGRVVQQESSKKVAPWRKAVEEAARAAAGPDWVTLNEPLIAGFSFSLPRGKTVRRPFHTTYPDLSKIIRSTEDALTTANIWKDDACVVAYRNPRKLYAGDDHPDALPEPGCIIRIWSVATYNELFR
ncbi:RusA family crossover junction endodeoxyribonuclease [Nonomuraea sp. NPDC050394]|uniref:RusA family crossover junction endodeoxyribonuclease n=1 Tax=Nonomuraea sp. NPDC050394 TaxID=3364363 RepID=UPI0037B07CB1